MKDIIHEILSEVHHLLSIATEEELRRAGNLPSTSPHLRAALDSLAAEKGATSRRVGGGAPEAGLARKPARPQKRGAKPSVDGLARELAKSFERLGKSEIQEACRSVGLTLSVSAKDARDRIVRRVANLVSRMSDEERERVLSAMRIKADTQTEGWVGVIRKGQ
jgi:hypothetical protein